MKAKLIHIEEEDFKKMEQVWRETGATTTWQIRKAIKDYLKTIKKNGK